MKVLDVARAALLPPDADAAPDAVRSWIGRVADALADGRELPPEARAALAGKLRRIAAGRSPDVALGVVRRKAHRPRRSEFLRRVDIMRVDSIVAELERMRERGEPLFISAACDRLRVEEEPVIPASWYPHEGPLRRVLAEYRTDPRRAQRLARALVPLCSELLEFRA